MIINMFFKHLKKGIKQTYNASYCVEITKRVCVWVHDKNACM